jgi:hypothetical protein
MFREDKWLFGKRLREGSSMTLKGAKKHLPRAFSGLLANPRRGKPGLCHAAFDGFRPHEKSSRLSFVLHNRPSG